MRFMLCEIYLKYFRQYKYSHLILNMPQILFRFSLVACRSTCELVGAIYPLPLRRHRCVAGLLGIYLHCILL
jgi:hypothetical protein